MNPMSWKAPAFANFLMLEVKLVRKFHSATKNPIAQTRGHYFSVCRVCKETVSHLNLFFVLFLHTLDHSAPNQQGSWCAFPPHKNKKLRNMRFKLLWLVIKSVQFNWNMNMSLHLFVWSPEKGLWQTRFLTEHWTCICCVHLPLMQKLIRRNFYQIPPYAEH